MRLYPPIWAIERRAIEDDTIAGYRIPAGSSVIISPYVLHRHPQFWVDPETFKPERFDGTKQHDAYIPFGAGPRYCIGNEFAQMEARLIVAMVLQLTLQIVLGLTGVVAGLPLLLVTAHNAGAALLLLAVLNLNHRVTPDKQP